MFPGRKVTCVAMGAPSLDYDIDAGNEYVRTECLASGWHALAVLMPQWSAERVAAELDKPGVIGLKPYYSLIGRDPTTRDSYQEAGHLRLPARTTRSKCSTSAAPGSRCTCRRPTACPIRTTSARSARSAGATRTWSSSSPTWAAATPSRTPAEALPPLADDPGLYFDISAVLNPAVHRFAFETFGPERMLYGTDNPVFYMRGRRSGAGGRTSTAPATSTSTRTREPPEVEAGYTLYMYEAMKATRDVCEELGVSRHGVEGIFFGNADRLIRGILEAKTARGAER